MNRVLRSRIPAVLMGVAVLWAGSAWAAWPEVAVKSADGVKYVNGGFGLDERRVMPAGYPLKVMFATAKGHYLSNVAVNISAGGQQVFSLQADGGPWLLVDLKPGTYAISATHNGVRKTASVTVPRTGTATALLTWKLSDVDMGLKD